MRGVSDRMPNIVVVGVGYWGKNLCRNFSRIGALSAVSDSNSELAGSRGQEYQVPAVTWQEILDNPNIDAVAIATPPITHAQLAMEAMNAGKHVFVEKPLALTSEEGSKVCECAETSGKILMVGHLMRYHPAFEKLSQMCEDGALGTLQYIYSNRLNLGKFRTEENSLWSFAPHDVSMILKIMGTEIDYVSAVGSSFISADVPDVTLTNIKFRSGCAAHIHVSWLHPFKEQRLVVIGDKGMAVFDDLCPLEDKLKLFPHKVNWSEGMPVPDKANPQSVEIDPEEPLLRECKAFVSCIQSGSRPLTNHHEGLSVLRILEAAQESMTTRSAVQLANSL